MLTLKSIFTNNLVWNTFTCYLITDGMIPDLPVVLELSPGLSWLIYTLR